MNKSRISAVTRNWRYLVFFSFDLQNSTQFKDLHRDSWPRVCVSFFEFVEQALQKWCKTGVFRWKLLGDEVLAFREVAHVRDFADCITAAYGAVESVNNSLHSSFPVASRLSVKGTIWSAQVRDFAAEPLVEAGPNISFRLTGGNSIDFLGPDVDAGFRISRFSARSRLVVGADLAYLAYLDRARVPDLESSLRIISYEVLRGVWEGRPYPILWYEKDWRDICESFSYDEAQNSQIVAKVQQGSASGFEKVARLNKVLSDLGRKGYLDTLFEEIGNLPDGVSGIGEPAGNIPEVEVHCAAVCFRADGYILVARRSSSKQRYPGKWEFGCGQLNAGESFADCLRRNYAADFGARLEIIEEPIPVQSYTITTEDRGNIPGIVFVASILNPDEVHAKRHPAVDWIDPNNLPPDIDESYVPYSRQRIAMAYHTWRSTKKPR